MTYSSTIPVYVKKIVQETASVKRFYLYPEENRRLPPFSAGSHVTTYIQKANLKMYRSYSLCGHPDITDYYEIAIKNHNHQKSASLFWHTHVHQGFSLKISYPRNYFPLSYRAKHHIFFAAGIGITPFIPMMIQLTQKGKSFDLYYAAPSKKSCTFYYWIKTHLSSRSHFYFSTEGRRMSPKIMKDQYVGTHVYFCGPPSMIKQFENRAIHYGYPQKSIHYELFSGDPEYNAKPFKALLRSSNHMLSVPKDKSLLDILLESGINIPYSCKVGRCGTCSLNVLAGSIDHHDHFLSDEERAKQNVILPCVSRGKSNKLILNL